MRFALTLPLVSAAALFSGCVVAVEDGYTVHADVSAIVVDLSNGELSIAGAQTESTEVYVEFGGLTFDRVGDQVIDDVLYLDFDCGLTCGGEIDLRVPPNVDVWLDVNAGEISARFDHAPSVLDIDLGAGEVDIAVPAGAYVLDLEAGAGEIHTDGVWHDPNADALIDANAGAGEIGVHGLEVTPR